MKLLFKEGYSVFKRDENKDIVIVVPHCGPALDTPTSNDANSETVASLLWKKVGGTLILSNLSRKRELGIDFNRKVPEMNIAIKRFKELYTLKWSNDTREFRNNYAFAAIDKKDYNRRKNIYKKFWAEAKKGKFIVLLHRALPRVKAYPSVIDIVTFNGKGVDKKKIKYVVENINEKYKDFFRVIEKDYKEMIMFEEKRFIQELKKFFGKELDVSKVNHNYGDELEKDINKINQVVKGAREQLYLRFDKEFYFDSIKKTLDKLGSPKITVEEVFTGNKALGPKKELFPNKGKIIMEIEPNRFLNFWYPNKTSRILKDIIEEIKKN